MSFRTRGAPLMAPGPVATSSLQAYGDDGAQEEAEHVGVGIRAPAVIPIIHTAQCRYFYRASDYTTLAKYFDEQGKMNNEARDEYKDKDVKKELLSNFRLYGRQLQLRQLMSIGNDPSKLLQEAIEVRQLVRALHVYQNETQGMYFARNTVESAIQDAVESVLRGSKPGLYPYAGGASATTHLNPNNGAEKKRPFEGYFKQPDPKKPKRPFKQFSYA